MNITSFDEVCYYLQTSPESTFTKKTICYRATLEGWVSLHDMRLIITTNGHRHEQELTSQDEYMAMLQKHFQIQLW
jgi:N-hydroxyarylamine O-acetyltransferase